MYDEQIVEPITRFEQQRCLFRHNEHVEAAEKIEVVSIYQQFRGWDDMLKQSADPAGPFTQNKFDMQYLRPQQLTREPPDLGGKLAICGGDDDLAVKAAFSQGNGDRQAVSDLMDLIVIEQETYAHWRLTSPPQRHRSSTF
jgi:hypothetical protein